MAAADHAALGTFAELVQRATRHGYHEELPTLAAIHVRSVADLKNRAAEALRRGVSQAAIEALCSGSQSPKHTTASAYEVPEPLRPDLPARRYTPRASMQVAMDAGAPNNRKRALAQLDDAVLASSTRDPMQSRLRTWTTLCRQWNVEPWPLDLYNVRAVAASLKAGAYKSAELYFDAAIWHQIHVRQEAVSPSLRRVLKDMVRSIKRGLPGTKVKAAFPFAALERIVEPLTFNQAYDAANPHHTVDLVIVAVWFMLREKELAAARIGDIDVQGDSLALSIPLRKTAQGGQVELTRRQLQCACRTRTSPRCPVHAAIRHLRRLRAAGFHQLDDPLAPTTTGATSSRADNVELIRNLLTTAEVPTTYNDPLSDRRELYGGHSCRVASAQFLAAQGVPINVIQLLGRWSSRAVERYTQSAPLALAPEVPALALHGRGSVPGLDQSGVWMLPPAPPPTSTPPSPTPPTASSATAAPSAASDEIEPEVVVAAVQQRSRVAPDAEDPDHFILHCRTHRLHRPDPDGEDFDQLQWKSPCGWHYGLTDYFRVYEVPSYAIRCRRCFRAPGHAQPAAGSDPDWPETQLAPCRRTPRSCHSLTWPPRLERARSW